MNTDKIPNIFHLMYFGGEEFDITNYLSIASVAKYNNPEKIFLYSNQNPDNIYWQKATELAEVVRYDPPSKIANIKINHPAHQTDIARLEILQAHGGVYLDIDVICRRSFSQLYHYPVVMGIENILGITVGICSAVIMAKKNALFLERWLDGFDPDKSLWKGFRSTGKDKYYSEMTTKYGYFLAQIYPEEVHLEPNTSFFDPSYTQEDLETFFETNERSYEKSYAHHLWSSAAREKYLNTITPQSILDGKSSFDLLAKEILGDKLSELQ